MAGMKRHTYPWKTGHQNTGGTCLFAEYASDHSEDVLYLLVKAKGEQIYSSSLVFPAKLSGPSTMKNCKRLCWFWLG